MKKIIMIAIVLISGTQLFAQNNNDKYSYNKEGLSQSDINMREAFIKAELQKEKEAATAPVVITEVVTAPKTEPKTEVTVSTAVPAAKKPTATAPVAAPKSELELRFENATKSGTPVKR